MSNLGIKHNPVQSRSSNLEILLTTRLLLSVIDALFLLDVVLNFCKTHEDPTTKEEIMDHCQIAEVGGSIR